MNCRSTDLMQIVPLALVTQGVASAAAGLQNVASASGSFLSHLLGIAGSSNPDHESASELTLTREAQIADLRRILRDELSARGIPEQPPIQINWGKSGIPRVDAKHPMRAEIEDLLATSLASVSSELREITDVVVV